MVEGTREFCVVRKTLRSFGLVTPACHFLLTPKKCALLFWLVLMLATLWLRSVERDKTRSSQSRRRTKKKGSPRSWRGVASRKRLGETIYWAWKRKCQYSADGLCPKKDLSHLDGVVSLGEVDLLLLLLLGDARSILLAQSSADGTGLLCAEVEGKVLLVLVEDAQLRALVDVDDGQDASDGLADVVATRKVMSENSCSCRGSCACVCLFRCFLGFLLFLVRCGIREVYSYILVSLLWAPPAIFWVRS